MENSLPVGTAVGTSQQCHSTIVFFYSEHNKPKWSSLLKLNQLMWCTIEIVNIAPIRNYRNCILHESQGPASQLVLNYFSVRLPWRLWVKYWKILLQYKWGIFSVLWLRSDMKWKLSLFLRQIWDYLFRGDWSIEVGVGVVFKCTASFHLGGGLSFGQQ